MDCSAIVLSKVIKERNIEIWSKLKLAYIDPAYSLIYSIVLKHYETYSNVPSFEELELQVREGPSRNILAALRVVHDEDIDIHVALNALIDQYTQNQAINMLEKYLDKLPLFDSSEIKEELQNIVISLDEKTHDTESVYLMSDINVFKKPEDISRDRVYLGISNKFDSVLNGVALEELILIGGKRGSGKSLTAGNIQINQFQQGNASVLFTIEMRAAEIFERTVAMLADVNYLDFKQGKLSESDVLKVVKARASMFDNSDDLILEYLRHKDKFKFEQDLIKSKKLKHTGQMILVDDRSLTISSIDLHLTKLKAKFGNNLRVCIVDYLNQVVHDRLVENNGKYDWKAQIEVATALKNLARKHSVVMVSPYQIDDSGEARFAKGILDSADISLILDAHNKDDGAMTYTTTKIRGGPNMEFTIPIDWNTLRMSSIDTIRPEKDKKKSNTTNQDSDTKKESASELWN